MHADENIPNIIDDLYAGALDDAAWNRALTGIADVVSGSDALLYGLNPTTGEVLRDEGRRFDPAALKEYREHWISKDLRIPLAMQQSTSIAVIDLALLPQRQLTSSEIFNDFLTRIDSPWFLVFWLHKGPERIVGMSINGTRHRGPFEASDGERIAPVIPHLRRALEIKDKLEAAHIRSDTYKRCLDSSNHCILILDSMGRLLELNDRAQTLLQSSNVIGTHSDKTLRLPEPASTELRRWILTDKPSATNTDGFVHIPRPFSHPLSMLITRLPQMATSWTGGEPPCWMLLVFDPEQRIHACKELVALALGISEREAEIASALGAGYSIDEIARTFSISAHTVRTHLKSCLIKTGCHSQNQLVRRIVTSPAWLTWSKNNASP